jgi:hypothetical protein
MRDDLTDSERIAIVQQLLRAIARASRYGAYRGNCFSRSLALIRLLRMRGIESDLRLGARSVDGQMEAHAWVERHGIVLNDAPDVAARFRVFYPVARFKI